MQVRGGDMLVLCSYTVIEAEPPVCVSGTVLDAHFA